MQKEAVTRPTPNQHNEEPTPQKQRVFMYVATIAAGAISRINSSVTALESRVDGIAVLYHNSMDDGGMSAAATRPTTGSTISRKKWANGTSFDQKVNLKGSIKEIE